MSSLLATKLHCPSVPARRVERLHLIARLDEGLESGRRMTLVSAPAGFGKTTCVSEWVDALDLPVAWLSLDPSDDDPGHFFTYLVAALQQVNPELGREIGSILRSGQLPSVEIISTMLVNQILECGGRFVLVMDDFQVIQDRFILQILERVVDNLPQPLHLILVTREDPSLPLARLRANNQMTEIRAGDLRFSVREADDFLNVVMGLSLSPADVAVLEDRTEGWVVGLQLAGFSVRDRADPSIFIASLSGSHRHILSYLTEEVLTRQPEAIQQFLLQTSILGKLSGGLCNAVTGRSDSHSLLEQLLGANLFLISLDDEQRWYRYHHLFADLLANRLRQTLPAESIQTLHRHASQWLADNELPDEAVQHALAGEDFERAASLIEQAARAMMFDGRVNTLKDWLERLPEASFHSHSHLAIYRVWIVLLQGACDQQTVQETDRMLNELPPSPENDRLRVEFMAILCRFVAFAGDTPRAIRLAEGALAHLSEGDLALRARAHSALVVAYGVEGEIEKAELAYRECLRLALASGNYSLAAHTTMSMAVGQTYYGRLHGAARLSQSIIDMGDKSGLKVFYPAGQGYVSLASIHLEWNDLETTERYATYGIDLCRQGGLDGVLFGHIVKSRLRQARGDFEGALEELRPLEQISRSLNDATLPARQIQIRLAMGDVEGASREAALLQTRLAASSATVHLPLLVAEIIQSVLIRVFIAQGDLERAAQLLDELQATAEAGGRVGRLIEVNLLRALAQQRQNQGRVAIAALEYLEHALDLAEPEGYVLLFLEESPAVIPLLAAFIQNPAAPARLRGYVQRLLDALPGDTRPAALYPADASGLVEPLTSRELEVLQFIAAGDSNQTIADKLVVTVSAVKKHTSNIFDKLDVGSRTQAIVRARQLGLLSEDQ